MTSAPVPFVDLAREYEEVRPELEAALCDVAASGRYVLGPVVERFEAAVAERLGVTHAVGVASGTDALRLALEAAGVGAGDEVVTSPFTFLSTASAILETGARPVFADIRRDTFNLDPGAVAAAVTPRTSAIVPVHLFGQMAEIETLRSVAERHGLALIEDAAQAFGARRRVPRPPAEDERTESGSLRASGAALVRAEVELAAGAVGGAGCFSFYPTKNLGALGDGGLAVTDDEAIARRLRRDRNHGRDGSGRLGSGGIGHNSRLDAIQAAALEVKLARLESWNARRRRHAAAYDDGLRGVPGIRTPPVAPGNRHVYHQYVVRCGSRSEARARLEAASVEYAIHYPVPLHRMEPLVALGYREGDFPEAERAATEVLSLPVFPGLRPDERERVVAALRDGEGRPRRLDRDGPPE